MTILTDHELAQGAAELAASPFGQPWEAPPLTGLSSDQVRRAAGISYRMLDHWTRRGFVGDPKQPGSGVRRDWTHAEARQVCILAALVRAGLRADTAAKHAAYVHPDMPWTDIGMPGVTIRVHTARLLRNARLLDTELGPDSNDMGDA